MNAADACRTIEAEGLVRWSSGNASQREGGYMAIKPSGIPCIDIGLHNLVGVSLSDGNYNLLREKPSTDTDTHRYIYNHLPEINGIVHTHSTFATAFAIAGIPIPCVCTAMADEFGGDIPVSNYCQIGGEEIGQEVVRLYKSTGCPAILIRQHGVFTVGKTIEDAVKAAVMAEDCAKTIFYAKQFTGISGLRTLPADEIARNHKRYTSDYGQK